jgi:hypothetical protein
MTDNPFSLVLPGSIPTLATSDNLLFTSASDFSHFIEQTAFNEGKTCTQAILDYCDNKDIEPSDVAKLIGPSLKGKIQMEMIEKGLLPEHNTLD